ncbi:MAG: HAMP domain-containing histidine kinase, partial [Candidatus Eisenbacteria bacterium]|nr:HAMP domain-containing histidine kinase [Candidatus Eisenbacteria bacterium]
EVGDRAESDVTIPAALYNEVVDEIDRDAERLKRVADRFSQIGSKPKLTEGSIEKIVEQTVDYFSHRLPRQSRKIEIQYTSQGEPVSVRFNPELLGWVLENLIKNAIDAADKDHGLVQVRVVGHSRNNSVSLSVRDNGRGVRPGMEKQIFRPGVSTRTRGWGLGLPLAQRIVTEYHRGRLELSWSEPGQGAEFLITLPGASSSS